MVNLKLAGVFGIIVLALVVISSIVSITLVAGPVASMLGIGEGPGTTFEEIGEAIYKNMKIQTIFAIFVSLFTVGFLSGFVTIGKMFESKLLRISAIILMVVASLGFVFSIISIATWDPPENSIPINTQNEGAMGFMEERVESVPALSSLTNILGLVFLLPLIIIFILLALTVKISFAVGLIRLKKEKVKLAELAGIFEIISLLIGFLAHVAMVFEIIIFFKLAKQQQAGGQQRQQYPPQQGPPRGRMPAPPREQMAPPRNLRPPVPIQ